MHNDWYDKLFSVIFWIMGWFCLILTILFVIFYFTGLKDNAAHNWMDWLNYLGFGMLGFMIFAGVQAIIRAIYLTKE